MFGPADYIRISRPRFWIYLFGPYLVGVAAAIAVPADLLRQDVLLFALYFLFPANLLVYGINDIYDYATDRLNPKKAGYETLVSPENRAPLVLTIFTLNLPFAILAFFLHPLATAVLGAFLFFSIFYSAPPIRAKAKPLLDSAFNLLYILPAIFAYQLLTGVLAPLHVFIAGWLWTMAMHAFSAVPDIAADREAGISTVATLFGRRGTILFCSALYICAATLALPGLGLLAAVLGGCYLIMMIISFFQTDEISVFSVYRWFPLVNAASGFAIFWYVFLPKIG